MKSSLVIGALFSLLTLNCFAQVKSEKAEITWGNEEKESRKSTLGDIAGYDESGFYAIKYKRTGLYGLGSDITLQHYNNKMNLTKSVELEMEYQKKKMFFEFVVQLEGELYLFTSFKNQKLKRNLLFVQSINKKTLAINKDMQKIAEISFEGKSKYRAGGFNYTLSNDSSKMLVYYELGLKYGEKEEFGFHVFDNNLTQLWEKNITLPYDQELFDVKDYSVDNNGNVHLLGKIFNEKRREQRKGKPNYKYQILSYRNNGEDLVEYPIRIAEKFLTEMQITINDEQDIICAGFYSEEGTVSIIGAYFLKVNGETKEITTTAFKEFGIDFITQNMTDKQERKTKRKAEKGKDVEMYEYNLDNIILREDGGAVLIGEQYFVEIVTLTSTDAKGKMTTSTQVYYNYNDIIVISISPEGLISWTEKIAKKQKTSNDGGFYSSYALAVVKDKLFFVFNDNPRNLFYRGEGKIHNFNKSKESLVVLVEVDYNGNQKREALFTSDEISTLTRPKVCEQISKMEMIIFGQKKKSHQFAKMRFK